MNPYYRIKARKHILCGRPIQYCKNEYPYEITYKVIHVSTNLERKYNINKMQRFLCVPVHVFDAFIGSQLDLSNLSIDLNYKYRFINEVGCYLSHYNLLSQITDEIGYTVVFEDDFRIELNFHEKIINILKKIEIDFDILFLGDIVHNNKGKRYKDNIYYIDREKLLWGTQGYLIKNKNIKKVVSHLKNCDKEIDGKYKELIDDNKITGLIIKPNLVKQDVNLHSTIR